MAEVNPSIAAEEVGSTADALTNPLDENQVYDITPDADDPQALPPNSQAPASTLSRPSLHSMSSSSDGHDASANVTLTNFQKYGSIRPPIRVLQDEFLAKYRLWKEHNDPLTGLETTGGRDRIGDAWAGNMASIIALHSRHHRGDDIEDCLGLLSSMRSNGSFFASEQKSEDEPKVGNDDGVYDGDGELNELQQLAKVLFRPGSKLVGNITLPNRRSADVNQSETSIFMRDTKSYELVVMASDGQDELGSQKGILARHKIRGDVQCVYLQVSFVPVVRSETTNNVESKYDELSEEEKLACGDGNDKTNGEKIKNLTIQIEYSDAETKCIGVWNHDALRFEGAAENLSEGPTEPNPMGGTIISGLIGARRNDDTANSGTNHSQNANSNTGTRSSTKRSSPNQHVFSLSPCSHIHTRGINPVSLWRITNDFISWNEDCTTSFKLSVPLSSLNEDEVMAAEKQKSLLDEIASPDNLKVTLHRARTDALRRETLTKLVELGRIVDFAELARKRSNALRREKWRKRVQKYTPKLPRNLMGSGRTTSSDARDEKAFVEKKKVQFYDHLASISWSDLLEESSLNAERVCAMFRRRAALLDSLTFESEDLKAQIMSDLRMNGLSLSNSHSEWDACIQSGRTIALGWSWFERGSWSCFGRSAVVGKRCVYLLFQIHQRLEANHDQLEKAYRKADGRLTLGQLDRISTNNNPIEAVDGEENEKLCGICQCDVTELGGEGTGAAHDQAIYLLCSHGFHEGCIREWLHNNSHCPICRMDLNVRTAFNDS